MPAQAPFLFSIAGVSASLAGLAGLVAALRRGSALGAMEIYRLRQIVEFAFANVILSLSAVILLGAVDPDVAVALVAIAGIVYFVVDIVVLFGRIRRTGLPIRRPWLYVVSAVDVGSLAVGFGALLSRSVPAIEAFLLVLLLRPMVAFLIVLHSFEAAERERASES
jgi:hypothetical protein